MGIDKFLPTLLNQDNRHIWDQNFDSGGLIKQIGANVQLHYIKTKKIAMVSSRDQYLVIYRKDIPADLSDTGKKQCIVACKSKDLEEYPPTPGNVRAQTHISGYFIEEISENECHVYFAIESDFKISLFISKQVAPKSSNYANALREYVD